MDYLQNVPATMCTTAAGLTAGTTTTFTVANAVNVAIKGKFGAVGAAASNQTTPTSDGNGVTFASQAIPKGYGAIFIWCLDGSSTTITSALKIYQGPVEALDNATDDGATSKFVRAPQLPAIPDTVCPFGALVIRNGTGAAATFALGTQYLASLSKVSKTWYDLCTLQDRLQAG